MNVQMIVVQAGIELAREVISSPVTKRLIAKALCKITSGSLCPLFFDFEKGSWKKNVGEYPTLHIHAADPDGDETTLTCSVEFARIIANGFARLVESLDYSKEVQLGLFSASPEDLGETLGLMENSLDAPLSSLEAFEEFANYELFGANQEA